MMRKPTVGKYIVFVAALAVAGMSATPPTATAADLKQLAEQLVNKVKGKKGGCGKAGCKATAKPGIREGGRTVGAGQASGRRPKYGVPEVTEGDGPGDGGGGSGGGAGKP